MAIFFGRLPTDKQEERKALALWGYELWVGHGQRLGVSTQAVLRREDIKPRWKRSLGSTTSINLCEGITPVCVLLCTLFHLEGTQKYLRSLGLSKFAWLYLGAALISLLLSLHFLLSYHCLHPTSTTRRRENSVVSQFRGFTSHGQDSVVHVIPWQARERERGMSVFSVFSHPSPTLFQPMKRGCPHVWQVFLIDTSGVVPE